MAAKTPPKSSSNTARQTPPPTWRDPLAQQQPLVSVRWLLGTVLIVIAVAAVCAYLTLCLLFYQGQWQIVFHPSRSVTTTPATLNLKYDDVRFDYTQTGTAQLAGWWIPAEPNSHLADLTILFLHDGRGSLSDVAPQLKILHDLGVNVFAFDYRGFGNSAADHPSEQRVYEDADAAWAYLTGIRHLNPKSIVLYGSGLGATIAAEAAIRHPGSSALILENPAPPALTLIEADARTSLVPIKWLFRDRFELIPRLRQIKTPKLFLTNAKTAFTQEMLGPGPVAAVLVTDPPAQDPHYPKLIANFLTTGDPGGDSIDN